MVERRSPKPQVGGSIPSWPAILLAWREEHVRMNDEEQSKQESGFSTSIKLLVAAAILIGGLYGYYYYENDQSLLPLVC